MRRPTPGSPCTTQRSPLSCHKPVLRCPSRWRPGAEVQRPEGPGEPSRAPPPAQTERGGGARRLRSRPLLRGWKEHRTEAESTGAEPRLGREGCGPRWGARASLRLSPRGRRVLVPRGPLSLSPCAPGGKEVVWGRGRAGACPGRAARPRPTGERTRAQTALWLQPTELPFC